RPRPGPLRIDRRLVFFGRTASRLVDTIGVDTGINPAPTIGSTIGAHLGIRGQMLSSIRTRAESAVDFCQHRFWVRIAFIVELVVPDKIQQWAVSGVGRISEFFADPFAQFIEEVQLTLAFSRRFYGLVAPLHH